MSYVAFGNVLNTLNRIDDLEHQLSAEKEAHLNWKFVCHQVQKERDAEREARKKAEHERDNMRVVMETAENESRQHAKRVEQLYMERDELAAALDEQGHSAACVPGKCNCVKSRVSAILAAHDAALVKPLVEALVMLRDLFISLGRKRSFQLTRLQRAQIDDALAPHKPCPTCKGTRETRAREPYPDESMVIVSACPDCAGGKGD